jgi:mono/diheme cytochrome c family protein
MKLLNSFLFLILLSGGLLGCENKPATVAEDTSETTAENTASYGSFNSRIAWGEHLVAAMDCNICHTPKKMSDQGPVPDASLLLSGRPADRPGLDIDRKEIEAKGLSVSGDFTEWAGTWGVSYAANLTPHETGIGNWTEEQFLYALRHGKSKGLEGSRTLLPPMPWQSISQLNDEEIKAIFAYLKSIKPIENLVPAPLPPISIQ